MPFVPDRKPLARGGFVPRAYSNVRVTPEAYGSAVGEGLQKLGQGLGNVAESLDKVIAKKTEEDNVASVQGADAALSDWTRQQRADEKGLFSAKGMQAQGVPDAYGQAFDEKVKELSKGMSPNAQRMFASVAVSRRNTELDFATTYAVGQRDTYLDDQAAARLNALQADAASQWSDPTASQTKITAAYNDLAGLATRKGWSPEVYDMKKRELGNQMYGAMINRALTEDPVQARALFEQYKDKLSDDDASKFD